MNSVLKPFYVFTGLALVLVGLVVWPLPIPFGIPMIAVGSIILLRHTQTGRRLFVRLGRRFPQSYAPIRRWLRRSSDQRGPTLE